jgi:hypothetical protein
MAQAINSIRPPARSLRCARLAHTTRTLLPAAVCTAEFLGTAAVPNSPRFDTSNFESTHPPRFLPYQDVLGTTR